MLPAQDLVEGDIELISLPNIYIRLKALLNDPGYARAVFF
jgi:hypothetical protein